ncbi:MAG: DUF5977 domain-containing protein, partial [Flavitalea sp.]
MNYKILSTVVFSFFFHYGITQVTPGLKYIAPNSPDAAALGKYGEIPVGNYTGIPAISIPIYTIKSRDLELPISINYHAGGIRLEEKASSVGCGWSLNAGGIISRTIRGMPDDYRSGGAAHYANTVTPLAKKYLSTLNPIQGAFAYLGNAEGVDVTVLQQMLNGGVDGQVDIFSFNFGKYSGTFFLDENGQFVVSPAQALKITYDGTDVVHAPHDFARWTLTTPDGVKYIFGLSSDGLRSALERNYNGVPWAAVTSWYLLDIISPVNDQIKLTYNYLPNYSYQSKSGEVANVLVDVIGTPVSGLPPRESFLSTSLMIVPKLSSIDFASGKVTFTSITDRTDVPGESRLSEIGVFNNDDIVNAVKKFSFTHDYSTGRLTLNSLREVSSGSVASGNTYVFEYYTPVLPNADPQTPASINCQDLWGFYNGVTTNANFTPSITLNIPNNLPINFPGADRHADETKMIAGTLKKITYPTRGNALFEYEANRVYTSGVNNTGIPEQPVSRAASIQFNTGATQTLNFTVANADLGVAIVNVMTRAQMSSCVISPITGISNCYSTYVQGVGGTTYAPHYLPDGMSTLSLPNGTYQMVGTGVAGFPTDHYYFQIGWSEYPGAGAPGNKIVGGLRIKRITTSDGINTSIKKYLYNKFSDPNASSGVMVNPPSFFLAFTQVLEQYGNNIYANVRSYPQIPLMPTQGSTIGYQNVTELIGENGENGKTEFTYSTANDYGDEIKDYRPYPPACSYDERRGNLLNSIVYKNSGSFIPIKSVSNTYFYGQTPKIAYGVDVDVDTKALFGTLGPASYYVIGFRTLSEFNYLQSATTRVYDQLSPANFIETIDQFNYDITKGHYQLTSKTFQNSKLLSIQTDFKYPQDVTLTGTAETARLNMISKFMLTPLLQQTLTTNSVQTSDTKNNYKVFSNGLVLPESIETKTGGFSVEKRMEFLNYDNYGNILLQHKMNDVLNSVLWDYVSTYPIAEVINADQPDIAYTSFEADGKGNWTFSGVPATDVSAPTGRKSYNLSTGTVTKSIISGSTYTISYWRPTGLSALTISGTQAGYPISGRTVNGWKYYEHKITGQTLATITGAGLIDELRLYPYGALMTTSTYDPIRGLTSRCDADSRITYYDYDAFGRLMLVRDQDRNILKKFSYNYFGTTENDNVWVNVSKSGSFQKTGCTGCLVGTFVTYSVAAGLYSSSISQIDADSKANDDVATNGPANANANGVCTAATAAPIIANNSISNKAFSIQFHNNCTNVDYNFTLHVTSANVQLRNAANTLIAVT